MRLTIAKVAVAAVLPFIFAAPALADEQHDKLMAMCTENESDPSTCDCQVKVLEDNLPANAIKVMIAMGEGSKTAKTQEEMDKVSADALAAGGMTKEEFEKTMGDAQAKAQPAMEACMKK